MSKRRRKKHYAGRLLAVLFTCLLVCLSVFLVGRLLIGGAHDLAAEQAGDPPAGTITSSPAEEDPIVLVAANPLAGNGVAPQSDTAEPVGTFTQDGALRVLAGERAQLPLTGLLIGIDPGHQEHANPEQEPVAPGSSETKAKVASGTQGCVTGTPEYAVNLQIALLLRERLEAEGAEVLMTRTTNDVDISNIERAEMCNAAGADLVLRLHCNGATNSNANGIGLYVTASGSIAEASYAAAEELLPAMTRATGAHPAGIFRRDTYSGLNWSTVPSILVEMGYMSNPEESVLLEDPDYQMKLVEGMTVGVAKIFDRSLDGQD